MLLLEYYPVKLILCPAINTFQMDAGNHPVHDYIDIINDPEANEGYECISEVAYDDGESSCMSKTSSNIHPMARQKINKGYKPDKQYETLNVYAEIPNMNYQSLRRPVKTDETTLSSHADPGPTLPSASKSVTTLPRKTCCGKSGRSRFWILLMVAVAIVLAITLVVVLTGI